MRTSQLCISPIDETDRHDPLTNAGFAHAIGDGMYALTPLGYRVLKRLSTLVRFHLERLGGQEVLLPLLQPAHLWETATPPYPSRSTEFGERMFRIEWREGERLVLAPTHEEVATLIGAACIREASDLPRVVYQIQTRFRNDAVASRTGLVRTKEFVMADAYSFHPDRGSLDAEYRAMCDAFRALLAACGVSVVVARADPGAMGGDESDEFVAVCPKSPVAAFGCSRCGTSVSRDIARSRRVVADEPQLGLREVTVRANTSFNRLAEALGLSRDRQLICVPVLAGNQVIICLAAHGAVMSLPKVRRTLEAVCPQARKCEVASAEELMRRGGTYEWVSVVRTPPSILILADHSIQDSRNMFYASNQVGRYLVNLNAGRDFRVDIFGDISIAKDVAVCPTCRGEMLAIRGMEVGHFFKLGTRFSSQFRAQFRSGGLSQPVEMGCYGLGLTRVMATVAEHCHDGRGLSWPDALAPYIGIVIPAGNGAVERDAAARFYQKSQGVALELLYEDSGGSTEQMLYRADRWGIPVQIVPTTSSSYGEVDTVDVRERSTGDRRRMLAEEALSMLRQRIGATSG